MSSSPNSSSSSDAPPRLARAAAVLSRGGLRAHLRAAGGERRALGQIRPAHATPPDQRIAGVFPLRHGRERDTGRQHRRQVFERVHGEVDPALEHGVVDLPGEQGPGVFGGVDFLRAVAIGESLPLGGDVVVIGGGNVAYDVARTVVRQAAYDAARTAARLPGTRRVRLVSLETLEEMPADTLEIVEGDEEGIERVSGWGPVAIRRGDSGNVAGLEIKRCLRVYDEQRRFSPQFDEANRQVLDSDTVLIAAGQAPTAPAARARRTMSSSSGVDTSMAFSRP